MQNTKVPISYWIKQADNLLTDKINAIQAEFGLNRTAWQILNSIQENENLTKHTLIELMRPFVDADKIKEALSDFISNDLIILTDDVVLTEKGKELFKQCLEKQKEFRIITMSGISSEDYQTTLQTLQKIVDNIENLA
ncbi:MAG: MarR family winged helix-turn-helix transcriptional regulator [Microscillaceae bacterium]|jgi:DNA-binding MarR family transcriptional regulator|nr:MarR family winged helix-turn-helix transcriptional regulator [Microscillaceae bacterium]